MKNGDQINMNGTSIVNSIETCEKKATREAYGDTLLELLNSGNKIVAVDADLSGSTTTKKINKIESCGISHLVNCGIAEQNMIDVACGLSLDGFIAFTGSFAVFGIGRCYDQIRNTLCYSNLNVKLCPTHAGISVGPDGGSHQMLEDIALLRALPNMRILVPSDYESAKSCIKLAALSAGPVYVRLGRAKLPLLYEEGCEVSFKGVNKLKDGDDITIIANGVEVAQALIASEILEKQGISCDVIDAYSVKPLCSDAILKSARKTSKVIVCEEHSINGGLCDAVASLLCRDYPCKCEFVAVKDTFGTSGEMDELMHLFNLDADAIVVSAKKLTCNK